MATRQFPLAARTIGLLCLLMPAFAAAQAEPAVDLQIGDVAPLFEGTDDKGEVWKLEDVLRRKSVVVYFYPADFTTGCTRQAESWRDNLNSLADSGVVVVGISGDSVDNHKLFKEVWDLNFTLLANGKADIAEKFGVPVRGGGKARTRGPDRQPLLDENGKSIILEREATFGRWTFVIDREGRIAYKNIKVNPLKDSEEVLAFIAELEDKE